MGANKDGSTDMKKQWAYEVTVTDRKGRTVYTGKYITFERAQRYAKAVLADTPNGEAYIYSRFDGTCMTLVADSYAEDRDFAGFTL